MYKVESDFAYNGLRCVVVFTDMGHRCGYVGVNENNPLYGEDYCKSALLEDVCVHGGITFSDGGKNSKYPVESDLWWFGFDCAHFDDKQDKEQAYEYGLITQERLDYSYKLGFLNYERAEAKHMSRLSAGIWQNRSED